LLFERQSPKKLDARFHATGLADLQHQRPRLFSSTVIRGKLEVTDTALSRAGEM
jgi:hypothetical protein